MAIFDRAPAQLDDDPSDDRGQQSLWAKVDHFDVHPNGYPIAVLDGIAASRVDGQGLRRGTFLSTDSTIGDDVSVIVVAASAVSERRLWYRVELGPGRTGAPMFAWDVDLTSRTVALQFDSLLGLGTPRPLTSLVAASAAQAAALGSAGSMSALPDIDPDDAEALLETIPAASSIAVLDVGQGSWNAVLDSGGNARAIFDCGGGVIAHKRSFPSEFNSFCFAEQPLVVLSHWDWDHWSSAIRFPEAQYLDWIVPRQGSLGPTHAVFLASLRNLGTVSVLNLPGGAALGPGRFRVQKAAGPPTSRNRSGLAVTVVGPDEQTVVMPGDAGYGDLTLPAKATSVVVPHHGGISASTSSNAPTSDGAANGRAVISSGWTSAHHPNSTSLNLHTNWAAALLHTEHRVNQNDPAHVELHWTSPAAPTSACCGSSTLPLLQR